MGLFSKSKKAIESTTTQNVAASAAATGGTVVGILSFLRAVKPEYVPWAVDKDLEIAALASTVLIPLLSRLFAFLRHPSKRPDDLIISTPPAD